MAVINPNQDYDIIHTLTFSEASGDCPIRLHRGSFSAISGTVYYRAGTSGDWTPLSVSGTSTTFPVTDTTMQIAHNWNKSGNNYMTPSFRGATNITSISISQNSALTGTMGDYFMYAYAYGCSSLTSLTVPDTSSLERVGNYFMQYYARGCSSSNRLMSRTLAVLRVWGILSCVTMLMAALPSLLSMFQIPAVLRVWGIISCLTMLITVPPSNRLMSRTPAVLQAWGLISYLTMLMAVAPSPRSLSQTLAALQAWGIISWLTMPMAVPPSPN